MPHLVRKACISWDKNALAPSEVSKIEEKG